MIFSDDRGRERNAFSFLEVSNPHHQNLSKTMGIDCNPVRELVLSNSKMAWRAVCCIVWSYWKGKLL